MSGMVLRAIAKSIEGTIGPGIGFALFIHSSGQATPDYISNCDRGDVIVLLEDWLLRQVGTSAKASNDQSSVEVDARLGLERLCVDIGNAIKNVPDIDVALFLMDFGDEGNLAYFSSTAAMRGWITTWLQIKKNPN